MWIFGYGSLMWDDWAGPYSCLQRIIGELHGYRRTFNKASVVNWGTKSNPGPTLNLEIADGGLCFGIAFKFPDKTSSRVKDYLEKREGKSFKLEALPVLVRDSGQVNALVPIYKGTNLITASSNREIAAQVLAAVGTSGTCKDYVHNIHSELLKLGIRDSAVNEIWSAVNARL